jgi:protein-tyrosine phosphatase
MTAFDRTNSRLLVVCTANECRSPLAQRIAQRILGDAGVQVAGAGVRAQEDRPMCVVSAAALGDGEDDRAFANAHRSHQLSEQDVRSADLVLVMERDHRAAVARLAPGTQARVFTFREAEGLLEVLRARGAAAETDLAGLARALHAVRGLAPLPPEPPRRRWFQRAPAEPVDPPTIVDGHGLDAERHEAAAATVRVTAERVATSMRALLAG